MQWICTRGEGNCFFPVNGEEKEEEEDKQVEEEEEEEITTAM